MLSTVLRSETAIRVSIRIAEHSRLWIVFRTLTKEVFVLAWRKANMKTEFNLIFIVKLVIVHGKSKRIYGKCWHLTKFAINFPI